MRLPNFVRAGWVAGFLICGYAGSSEAEPIVPKTDEEIVEVLPAASGNRNEDRRSSRLLAERPDDWQLAVSVAKRNLTRAREAGDPRFAGLALAALNHWPVASQAPDEVLLLQATLQQYLHEFDRSIDSLGVLLKRPTGARIAQAWLTLATVRRVQGRYAESDAACRSLGHAGADLFARACIAENAGLKGQVAEARKTFQDLLADPRVQGQTQGWLLTSLAELEQRDGKARSAEAAFKSVLALGPDAYAVVDYADFLIDQGRPCDALPLLKNEVRTDAVLLRLAIAGTPCKWPGAHRDVEEMRDRIELANRRPDAKIFHGREQAMFALLVEHSPQQAVELARGNAQYQREAIDLLVYARAAKASGDAAAIDEVRALRQSIGLFDRRIDSLF